MRPAPAAALLCAGVALLSAPASADDVSADLACRFRHRVEEVASFDRLPAPIAGFVRAKMNVGTLPTGEFMAPRGGFFNATDVIMKPAPGRRFIRAGHSGNRWFLWYEHGGITYSKTIAVLDLSSPGRGARLVALIGYFSENPCELTDLALDGKGPSKTAQPGWW